MQYVLIILTIVYVFNFIDRQIVSILAEDLKSDLKVTDAQLGILYGTVFRRLLRLVRNIRSAAWPTCGRANR